MALSSSCLYFTYTTTICLAVHLVGRATVRAIPNVPQEYCQFQTFNASCPNGQVIQMTEATYGRMSLGKCVEADLGFVGCSVDVLSLADRKCSGRQTCAVSIPDEDFDNAEPCLQELKFYLRAAYTCVNVETVQHGMCGTCDYVRVTRHSGTIPSHITELYRCGSPDCPWDIEVAPGQRINITLVDFALTSTAARTTRPGGCRVYATIKERATSRRYTICGGDTRERLVYTSSSHSIQIRIVGQNDVTNPARFLLKYQAVGCADISAPYNGWVSRVNTDDAILGCNSTTTTRTQEQWRMRCEKGQWKGTMRNCTASVAFTGEMTLGSLTVRNGISIVIILAVAITIGACILLAGLIIIRRSRPRLNPQYQSASQYGDKPVSMMSHMPRASFGGGGVESGVKGYHASRSGSVPHGEQGKPVRYTNQHGNPDNTIRRNEYTHIWQRPLPEQPSDQVVDSWNTMSECGTINPYEGMDYATYRPDPTLPPPPSSVMGDASGSSAAAPGKTAAQAQQQHPTANVQQQQSAGSGGEGQDIRYYQLEPETGLVE